MSSQSIYVPQGHFETSSDPAVYMTTVLGSCVAACVWDERRGVGGMNHLLLPPHAAEVETAQGIHLMELLINALLKSGATKTDMKVKLFGGARMMDPGAAIGERNAAFAREFFDCEDIDVVKESLGGTSARRVQFWPTTGQARLRMVRDDRLPRPAPPLKPAAANHVELF